MSENIVVCRWPARYICMHVADSACRSAQRESFKDRQRSILSSAKAQMSFSNEGFSFCLDVCHSM